MDTILKGTLVTLIGCTEGLVVCADTRSYYANDTQFIDTTRNSSFTKLSSPKAT